MPSRICPTCKKELNIEQFELPRQIYCRACTSARIAAWRHKKKAERDALSGPVVPRTHKQCSQCLEEKALGDFYMGKSGKWYSSYCKPCCVIRTAERQSKIPDRVRDYALKYRTKTFGTTPEWFRAKLKEQHGVCAICQKPETDVFKKTGRRKALAIDHDHITKKVRGLLCTKCNQSLFLLEKHEGWADKAVQYLHRYSGQSAP